jgi:hypothetical protein
MLVMSERYGSEDESMTHYRRFFLGAVVWLLVVSAGATLVWTVISDAGAEVAGELPATTTGTSTGDQPASDRPSTTAAPSPTATATGTGPAAPSTSAPEQPVEPQRRSWRGAAGVVVAECRGGVIALSGAQPNSGWGVEVDSAGPDTLRVEFENASKARVRVEAACVDGAPSFSFDSDRD